MANNTVYFLVPAVLAGIYFLLYRWRFNKFAHIPTPLKSNLFIGHLGYIAAEFKKAGNPKIHPGWSAHLAVFILA